MHAEICIAMHMSIQMKLYRAAIIQEIKSSSIIRQMAVNTHAATFMF